MTNKLSRSEFMKSGIVAALGLIVPKFIANIGGYVTGIGRGSPMIYDNWGLTIDLEERKGKTWFVETQEEFQHALANVKRGDAIFLGPGTYEGPVSYPANATIRGL